MKQHHGCEVSYQLKYAIVTCRIFYRAIYNNIERKPGITQEQLKKIATWAVERTRCEDVPKVLVCVRNLDKFCQIPCVIDGTEVLLEVSYCRFCSLFSEACVFLKKSLFDAAYYLCYISTILPLIYCPKHWFQKCILFHSRNKLWLAP